MSRVDKDRIEAYLATSYRLGHNDQDIVFNIGRFSQPLADLLLSHQVVSGVFLSAFNPRGAIRSHDLNMRAHEKLSKDLMSLGHYCIEGSGNQDDPYWPAEWSFFVLGLDRKKGEALGEIFEQDAIVWVEQDAIPQLILLR